jgi:hypothetical protein
MTEPSNIVEFRSSRKHIEMPLSLGAFHKKVQSYLDAIIEAREPLQDIYDLFRKADNIWPDQCEYAIDLMQIISESVQKFCQLLNTSTRIPDVVVPLRYPLLITLHNMSELVISLIRHVSQFRTVSQTSSKRITMQRQAIESSLEELIQRSEDAKHKAEALFDQVDQAHILKHELANR